MCGHNKKKRKNGKSLEFGKLLPMKRKKNGICRQSLEFGGKCVPFVHIWWLTFRENQHSFQLWTQISMNMVIWIYTLSHSLLFVSKLQSDFWHFQCLLIFLRKLPIYCDIIIRCFQNDLSLLLLQIICASFSVFSSFFPPSVSDKAL